MKSFIPRPGSCASSLPGGGEWITLCNTATAWKGIPTDICKLWQAQALGAQITQVYTLLPYPSTAASTCAVMGTLGTADAASAFTTY